MIKEVNNITAYEYAMLRAISQAGNLGFPYLAHVANLGKENAEWWVRELLRKGTIKPSEVDKGTYYVTELGKECIQDFRIITGIAKL